MAPAFRVAFDTTTLCGAFLSPSGLCRSLLMMARAGILEPIISQEVVSEWRRIAREGRLGGKHYPDDLLDAFVDLMAPLLENTRLKSVRAGRVQVPLLPLVDESGLRIVTQHPDRTASISTHMRDPHTVVLKDPFDAHLIEAALAYGCHYLCTSNTRDFPDGLIIGPLTCVTPEHLMALVEQESE